ncbi:TPA: hypothetical protein ACGO4K_001172 [Streptococcus suis]
MKRSLVQVPLALSGLLLALVALANLLDPVHSLIKPSLQALALLGYSLLFTRIFAVCSKTRGWAKSPASLLRVRINISAQWLIGRFVRVSHSKSDHYDCCEQSSLYFQPQKVH